MAVFLGSLAVLFGAGVGAGKLFAADEKSPALVLSLDAEQSEQASFGAPVDVALSFEVLAGDEVVTDFVVRHEKPLHLIAVTTDFLSFEHLHPTMTPTGTWSVSAPFRPGTWRLYADFQRPGAEPTVLSQELAVAGSYGVNELVGSEQERRAVTEDGRYTVDLAGDLTVGGADLGFTIRGPEGPITDLDPYLGAYGHMVVIRESDLQYLHVHPDEGPAGPQITFGTEVPSTGRYRLYLDFQHAGKVQTAAFALDATPGAPVEDHQGGSHGNH